MTAASRDGLVRAADLPTPLHGLAEQLWFGVDDDVRFLLTRTRRPRVPGHRIVEQYAVVPTLQNARMLLPARPAAAARGSAGNYRALRLPRERAVRTALAAAAATGAPLSPHHLHVLVPHDRPAAAESLPLQAIGAAVGEMDLRASIGLRSGANRKATLQLVHVDGSPAGYAKLGWNATSDDYVRTESRALAELASGTGRVRAPRRLAALEHGGHPIVVTEPLPMSARAVRPGRGEPTPAELHDVAPVVRTDHLASINQVRGLQERLDTLTAPVVAEQVQQTRRLLRQVAELDPELTVAVRWHGDFTFWNTARDAEDNLWVWDWEGCEPDAPAGLDALHWAFTVQRETVGPSRIRLADCVADSAPHLVASGVPRATWGSLMRIYLAATIERTCGLAVASGGWDRLWIQPDQLTALVAQAEGTIGSE